VPRSGPVKDRTLTLDLNGAAFTALKQGTTKLVSGRDYTLSGNRLTLKAAALPRLVGDRSPGVNATLQAGFSRGVPWRIQVVTYDTPVQTDTTGTTASFGTPTQFRGDSLATMQATYADGSNAGPTNWTSYQGFNTAFAPYYAKKTVRLTPAFLDAVKNNARVNLLPFLEWRHRDVPRDQVGKRGDRHDVLTALPADEPPVTSPQSPPQRRPCR